MKLAAPKPHSLANFDYAFNGTFDQRQVEEIVSARLVSAGENLIINGGCGTGKTVIATALQEETERQGLTVEQLGCPSRWTIDEDLFANSCGIFLRQKLFDCDLLVVDDTHQWLRNSKALALLLGLRYEEGKSNVLIFNNHLPHAEQTFSEPPLPWQFRFSRFAGWLRGIRCTKQSELLSVLGIDFAHPALASLKAEKAVQRDPRVFVKTPVWHYLYTGERSYREVLMAREAAGQA